MPWVDGDLLTPANLNNVGGLFITPEDYGAIGDGTTDDTTALQAAIDAAQTEKLPLYAYKAYGVSSRIVIGTGEKFSMFFPPFHQIVKATETGIIPLATFSDADNIVLEMQEIIRFHFGGALAVNNRVNTVANLVGVVMHNSDSGLTLGGNGTFDRIFVGGCETALRVGDNDTDGYQSNFEGFRCRELVTYGCGTVLKIDSTATDLINFDVIRSSGESLDRTAQSTTNKIHIKNVGNTLDLGRIFLNVDDLVHDSAVIDCDDSVRIQQLSIEGAASVPCRVIDLINANGGRDTSYIGNVLMAVDQGVDTSGYSAKIGYGPGTHLQNCSFTGSVLVTEKTTYNNVIFQNTAPSGHAAASTWPAGFVLSGARAAVNGTGHYERASASTGSGTLRADSVSRPYVLERWETDGAPGRARELVLLKNEGSANVTDNTDYEICTVTMGTNTGFAMVMRYYMFDSSGAQAFVSTGEIEYAATQDSADNVTLATPALTTPLQVLDGYSTVTVTADMVDNGDDTVTCRIKQDNNLNVNVRCVFEIKYFASSGNTAAVDNSDIDLTP